MSFTETFYIPFLMA